MIHPEDHLDGIALVFHDALKTGVRDYLDLRKHPNNPIALPADYVAEALRVTLTDLAVRREVHNLCYNEEGTAQLSRMDVHTVLDALVSVLYPTTEDPTTTEEQEVDSSKEDGSG